MGSGSFNIDHAKSLEGEEQKYTEDPSTDPEGEQRRAERPPVNSMYASDMMEYNAVRNRWGPAEHFIRHIAKESQRMVELIQKRAQPLEEEVVDTIESYLNLFKDRMDQGPFNGFLYGSKDALLKQICSSIIWMEFMEDIRASRERQGADEEDIQRAQDGIDKNATALQFLARVIGTYHDLFEVIAVNEFAWLNAARGASWDFLGSQTRQAQNPDKSKQRDARRRSAEEMMGMK